MLDQTEWDHAALDTAVESGASPPSEGSDRSELGVVLGRVDAGLHDQGTGQ